MIALHSGGDPQKRRTPEARDLPGQSTNGLLNHYHSVHTNQVETPANPWMTEAKRLADEYLFTGLEKHRLAFERQMGGILVKMKEAL